MPGKPFFSIVIPTLNEEKCLPELLEDLSKQTFQNFEVLHVDAASEDATVQKAQLFAGQLNLTSEQVSKRNVAFQRNSGGKLARGAWVLFMDADNRLPSYFLQGIKYQIEKHPQTDVFTTWIKVDNGVTANKTVKTTIENAINLTLELYQLIGKEASLGAMICAKKTVVSKVKFKETLQIFEDVFFVQSAIAAGFQFRIFREPQYTISLRRMKKEGSLKMFRITAAAQLNYILGNSFETKNHGYVMEGGTYYEQSRQSPLRSLQKFIEKASANQLQKAKRILKTLQEFPR
jgi:hypothetical protein